MITRQVLASHEKAAQEAQQRVDMAVAHVESIGGESATTDALEWAVGELAAAFTALKLVTLLHFDEAQRVINAVDAMAERKF